MDGAGARLGDKAGDQFQRVARHDMQNAAKRGLQRGQGMMKPPAVAAPMLSSPAAPSSRMKTGSTSPRAAAAQSAGLSASRRSWRNQQMERGRVITVLPAAMRSIAAYWRKRLPLLCENGLVRSFRGPLLHRVERRCFQAPDTPGDAIRATLEKGEAAGLDALARRGVGRRCRIVEKRCGS